MNPRTAALVISLLFTIAACETKSQYHIPASIQFVSGTVLHNGSPAKLNDPVHYNDIIETKEKSFCRIVVDGKNVIGLQNNTTFVYRVRANDGLVELKRGHLAAVIKNRRNIQDFRVMARTVTASVRGTAFFIGMDSPEETYTCTCNGRVSYLASGETEAKVIAAPHHHAVNYNQKGTIIETTPGVLKGHDDSAVEALAAAIGEKIDWTKIPE